MTMEIKEAIKFVKDNISEDDAFTVFYAMMKEFGWAGTVFSEHDVRESIQQRRDADDKEPYTPEEMDEAVATVMASRGWNKVMEEWLCQQGYELLGDLIFDEVEYPEQQKDN